MNRNTPNQQIDETIDSLISSSNLSETSFECTSTSSFSNSINSSNINNYESSREKYYIDTSSYSNNSTDEESCGSSINENEISYIQKLKNTIKKIKNNSINENISTSDLVFNINRLCEIDIQLTEIICNLKDLIVLLNDQLGIKDN